MWNFEKFKIKQKPQWKSVYKKTNLYSNEIKLVKLKYIEKMENLLAVCTGKGISMVCIRISLVLFHLNTSFI